MPLGREVCLGSDHFMLDGDPAPIPQRGTAPNFRPIHVAAKWLHGSRCHLVYGGRGLGDFVLDGDFVPPPQKGGGAPLKFSAHVYCGQKAGWIKIILRTQVGLSAGDLVVLDGDPAPLPK